MKGRNTPLDADLIETSYQLLRIPTTSSSSEEVERDTGVSLRIVNETFEDDIARCGCSSPSTDSFLGSHTFECMPSIS